MSATHSFTISRERKGRNLRADKHVVDANKGPEAIKLAQTPAMARAIANHEMGVAEPLRKFGIAALTIGDIHITQQQHILTLLQQIRNKEMKIMYLLST